jgi:hypothetical protein
MLSSAERQYVLRHGRVPEHLVDLMVRVSGGDPVLVNDCLCILGGDWAIVVGYPLEGDFRPENLKAVVAGIVDKFRPGKAWLIAPELPPGLPWGCVESESDHYYTLKLPFGTPGGRLRKITGKAREQLTVERGTVMTPAHMDLVQEFIDRVEPHPRVRRLALALPEYTQESESCSVLSAVDVHHRLAAFYVVDLGADRFSAYVIGCYSRKNYVPWASDLLMYEMIGLSEGCGKEYIHLGLGVNAGIRRFKKKWGGLPGLPYKMCQLLLRKPSLLESLMGGYR